MNMAVDIDDLRRAFKAREVALFLDVDGTLLEIAQRPDGVRVSAALRRLIAMLAQRNDNAVAFVSGRTIADLDRLFDPLRLPAAGLHGLERRDVEGRIHGIDRSADLHDVRQHLSDSAYDEILIEDKGSAIVLHYRERPDLEQLANTLAQRLMQLARGDWSLVPGKMSYEIRAAGITKRDAIHAFLAEAPFRHLKPAFFGDDVSDEEGFAYVNSLDGWSVHIGAGSDTCARAVLAEPRNVWQLLSAFLDIEFEVERS
ncbi:MAG: trehalose-phosphatase [Steroidobacteraceae bacterium]